MARTGWRSGVAAAAAGLLLGGAVYLSYGLVLGGLLAAAVLVRPSAGRRLRVAGAAGGRRARRGERAGWRMGPGHRSGPVARGSGSPRRVRRLVVAAFTLAGFSWLDGYAKVRVIYAASIAAARPYSYFVWANLAAVAFAIGPAGVAGLRRVVTRPGRPYLVVVAAVAAMLLADLSGMSKAEVERIWLPFAVWTCLACAELPRPRSVARRAGRPGAAGEPPAAHRVVSSSAPMSRTARAVPTTEPETLDRPPARRL